MDKRRLAVVPLKKTHCNFCFEAGGKCFRGKSRTSVALRLRRGGMHHSRPAQMSTAAQCVVQHGLPAAAMAPFYMRAAASQHPLPFSRHTLLSFFSRLAAFAAARFSSSSASSRL